jgi:DNA-binding response OmpR family regulator
VKKILVVEDDPSIRQILGAVLSANGYSIVTAATGTEALEVHARERPDLMLVDIELPSKSGREVCQHIKKMGGRDAIPIVLMSAAYADPEHVQSLGKDVHADGYLPKPFNLKQVVSMVKQLLGDQP